MRDQSSNGSVHTIDPSMPDDTPVVTGYNPLGLDIDPNDPLCLAKQVYYPASQKSRHFLKRCTTGVERERLYNPQTASPNSAELMRRSAASGSPLYEFRTASQEAFEALRPVPPDGGPQICASRREGLNEEALSKAEQFYIEQHAGKKSPKEIADDLGVHTNTVAAAIKKIPTVSTQPVAPQKPTNPMPKGFEGRQGSVSMTQSGSMSTDKSELALSHAEMAYIDKLSETMSADEIARELRIDPLLVARYRKQQNSGGVSESFVKSRLRNSVHVIDPSLPVR